MLGEVQKRQQCESRNSAMKLIALCLILCIHALSPLASGILWGLTGGPYAQHALKIDPATGALLATIPLPGYQEGSITYLVADITHDGTSLWGLTGGPYAQHALKIDPATGALLATIPLPGYQEGSITYLVGSIAAERGAPVSTPSAPSNLACRVVSSTRIDLRWTDNSTNEDGFKIERKTGVGGVYSQIATVAANVTSYSDIGVTPNSQYCYRVMAYNAAGDSSHSNEACCATPATNAVTNLNTGQGFASIQAAIDAPETQDGHTILVNSAEYDSANEPGGILVEDGRTAFIAIWKALTVRSTDGAANTVLDGSGHSWVVAIWADDVTFEGFTITGATSGVNGWDFATGIELGEVNNVSVRNNIVTNNDRFGIKVWRSNDCEIKGNTVDGTRAIEGFAAGIFLEESQGIDINGNTVTENAARGILLQRSHNNVVGGNTVSGTTLPDGETWGGHGIELPWSNSNHVHSNTVVDNDGIGIVMNGASYNIVENNTVIGNGLAGGQGSWGINIHSFWEDGVLRLAQGNQVLRNTISDTAGGGLVIGSAIDNIVEENTITNNEVGIVIGVSVDAPASGNIVRSNTIDGNWYQGIRVSPGNSEIVIENNIIRNTRYEYEEGGETYVYGFGIMCWGSATLGRHERYTIRGNQLQNNAFGMFLSTLEDSVITDNIVENSTEATICLGALLYYSDDIEWVIDSCFEGGGGIYLCGERNTLARNTVRGNGVGLEIQGGIENWVSQGNVVEENTVVGNPSGTLTVQLEKWQWVEGQGTGKARKFPWDEFLSSPSPEAKALLMEQGYWQLVETVTLVELQGFGLLVVNSSQNEALANTIQNNGEIGVGYLGFNVPEEGLSGQANRNVMRGSFISGHGTGVWLGPYACDNLLELNTIADNPGPGTGVRAETAVGNVVRYSQITGNGTYGVVNTDPVVLDARHNWWGSAGGPGSGGANGVSGNVLYSPWWTSPNGTAASFRIERETGNVLADGAFFGKAFQSGSADVAEWVRVSEPVNPGDVLEFDPTQPGFYRKARGPCSTLVAGVVSTQPGVVLGHSEDTQGKALLALIGIVPLKVTDEGGPIRPGDLLVASSTPGYAMRWDPEQGEICQPVGKALEPWEGGQGVILVLLMR